MKLTRTSRESLYEFIPHLAGHYVHWPVVLHRFYPVPFTALLLCDNLSFPSYVATHFEGLLEEGHDMGARTGVHDICG